MDSSRTIRSLEVDDSCSLGIWKWEFSAPNRNQSHLNRKIGGVSGGVPGKLSSKGILFMDITARQLYESINSGDAVGAKAATEQALARGTPPLDLVNLAMMPAMDEAGKKFEQNELFVPDLLIRARAMKTAMGILRPLLSAGGGKSNGRVLLGTVQGDVHDLGKNLVGAMLEGASFEIIDMGVGIAPEVFVQKVKETGAQIVALSALLTTTMNAMTATIQAFDSAGLRDKVKIIIGGAPISSQFADEIGADGTSTSAIGAVVLAKKLVGLPVPLIEGVHLC